MRDFLLKQAGPFVFRVHTSRSHFAANSGYKETPTTPSVTNSGPRHITVPAAPEITVDVFFCDHVTSQIKNHSFQNAFGHGSLKVPITLLQACAGN